MANFFNPYMKGPDWAQGLGDISNQFMMMYLLGMFNPKKKTTETMGVTPISPSRQIPQQVMQNIPGYQAPQGQAFGGIGTGTMGQNLNSQQIQQLLQMLMSGGIGGF